MMIIINSVIIGWYDYNSHHDNYLIVIYFYHFFAYLGSISSQKLFNLLFGKFLNTFICEFAHSDTGVVFGLDKENKVIITKLEKHSPSSTLLILTKGLRLLKINDAIVDNEGSEGLKKIKKIIYNLNNKDKIKFEFIEPSIVISIYSCILDIEIDNTIYTLNLPIGAVYNIEKFSDDIQNMMNQQGYPLSLININIDPLKKQVFFTSDENDLPFRLLFGSGPNSAFSVRYVFGFTAENLAYSHSHIGYSMVIDLNLK